MAGEMKKIDLLKFDVMGISYTFKLEFSLQWSVARLRKEIMTVIGAKENEYNKWGLEMTYEWDTDDNTRGWETSTDVIEMSENRKKIATLLGHHRLVMFIIRAPMKASAESVATGSDDKDEDNVSLEHRVAYKVFQTCGSDVKSVRFADNGIYVSLVDDTSPVPMDLTDVANRVLEVCGDDVKSLGFISTGLFINLFDENEPFKSEEKNDIVGTPPYTSDEEEEEPVFVETERVTIKNYQNKSPMFFGRINTSMTMLRLKNYMYELEDVSEENKARLSLCNGYGEIYDDDAVVSDVIAMQGNAVFFLKIRGLAGGGKAMTAVKKQTKIKDLKSRVVAQSTDTSAVPKNELMKSADAIVERFGNQVEADAISALKGFIGSNTLQNLEQMLVELNENKAGTGDAKVRAVAHLFYGDLTKQMMEEYEAMEKLVFKGKLVLEYGFVKSELGIGKLKDLVKEAVDFKRGQSAPTSGTATAMETKRVVQRFDGTYPLSTC